MLLNGKQKIKILEPRKGGCHYLKVDSKEVETWKNKKRTRLICILDNRVEFRCGLNHLGDGNFFVIISNARLKKLKKKLDDEVCFEILEDPNPLGVDIPDVLLILLEQDKELKHHFDGLTDGKKRGIIHQIIRIKNVDLQVSRSIKLIQEANQPKGIRK